MSTTLYIDSFAITENGRFTIETRVTLNELGFPDTKETFIEIEGDIVQGGTIDGTTVDTTPAGVYAAMENVLSQLNTQSPKHVYVDVDGSTKFDFPPSSCINSPIITNFRTITDTGAGDMHWKYGLSIYIRQLARTSTSNVSEFSSSIITTFIKTNQGNRPIRKHWAATAKASDVNVADAFIGTLEPSAPSLTSTRGRFFQEGRATGDWVWEYNQNQKIVENISVTGRGSCYEASTQVSASGEEVPPIFHRTPHPGIVIVLDGEISSSDIDLVVQPDLHWTESDSLFHDVGREQGSEKVIFDDMRGLYKLKYQERWVGSAYTAPNHNLHNIIPALPEPNDGAIAGIQR